MMGDEVPESGQVIVRADDVVKEHRIGDRVIRAVDGVSLEVAQGRFVAVMGPSGSGKSTLLQLLGALDTPSSGEVWHGSRQLSSMDDDARSLLRREAVGFVFQQLNLVSVLTARENVELPLVVARVHTAARAERVDRLLELVGLGERADHLPEALSGGEQQRVAIARALVHEPALVLADEPTGSLDSTTGDAVLAVLRSACTELGQTVVMVTHEARVAAVADEIVQLRDGRITDRQRLRPDPGRALSGIADVAGDLSPDGGR